VSLVEALFIVLALTGAMCCVLAVGAAIADRLPRRWI